MRWDSRSPTHRADPTGDDNRGVETPSPGSRRRRVPAAWPLVVLLAGLALTLWAAARECGRIADDDRARFHALCARLTAEVNRRIGVYRYGLVFTRGLYMASRSVERAEFHAWFTARDLPLEFPGAQAIGFIRSVTRADLDGFLAATRADDAPDFAVTTSGDHPDLFITEFIEPAHADAPGFDWARDPHVRAALEDATLDNQPRATPLLAPGLPVAEHGSILVALPVYRNGVPVQTPQQRRDAIFGWVYMPLDPGLMFHAFTQIVDRELDLHISDGGPDGPLLYDDDACQRLPAPTRAGGTYAAVVPLEFAGRRWSAAMRSTSLFRGGSHGPVWVITLGGLAVSGMLGILLHRESTGLRRARALARSMTAELRLLAVVAERTSNAVAVTDARRRIIWVNEAFTRIKGYTLDELCGLTPGRVLQCEETDPATVQAIREALNQGRPFRCELLNRAKDGRRIWLDVEFQPVRDPAGRVVNYISVQTDVTERRRAEAELREARLAAEEASRAKSEFLANMSHEIRTPITAILGFADLLVEQGEDLPAPERLEHARTIRRNSEHLLKVINDILDISKIESGRLTVERLAVSPARVIAEVVSMMSVRAREKGLTLSVEVAESMPALVLSDPVRLRQVLFNLVGNAIKFTQAGSVTIRAAPGPDGQTAHLRIDVVDTGIGMTPEQIGRIFNPFVQGDASTTRRFGGSGLGLVISQRLAAMLGGRIAVVSEPAKGSTFTLTLAAEALPEVPGAAVNDGPSTPALAPMALAGARILLAEDTQDNQRLIAFHLRRAGADVHVVESGRRMVEALTACGSIDGPLAPSPPFDLVLTDVQMPDMDGLTAVRLLRRKGCGLPIASLTAHAMSGDADRCLAAGCDAHVPKPIDKDVLLRTCHALLRERRRAAA